MASANAATEPALEAASVRGSLMGKDANRRLVLKSTYGKCICPNRKLGLGMIKSPKKTSPLGDFLLRELKRVKKNWSWLAVEMDVSTAAVAKWRKTGQVAVENIPKLASLLGRSTDEIFEAMAGRAVDESSDPMQANRPDESKVYVNFVKGAHLSAGSGEVMWDFDEVEHSHSFNRQWMQKRGLDSKRCKMWEVKGDSMWPTIPAGSAVMINTAERDPINRKIFAIITDEGLRLKRLLRRVDGQWEIHSDNPDKNQYPVEPFTPGQIAILGRMRWSATEH
jgi:phage repressor protein C with HTH and peptisase S24 domain